MPLRERLLQEDETTKELDDFSALILDDLKKSGFGDEDLFAQIAAISKDVNELHHADKKTDKK